MGATSRRIHAAGAVRYQSAAKRTLNADASGRFVLGFQVVIDSATISGIEAW
jgi:hypothetical protein